MVFYWFIAGALIGFTVGGMVSVLWAPFLASTRIKAAFLSGPSRSWRWNYTGWFILLGASHTGMLAALMSAYGTPDVALAIILRVSTGFAMIFWGIIGVFLPLIGRHHSFRTLVLAGLGAGWYTVLMTGLPYGFYLIFHAP